SSATTTPPPLSTSTCTPRSHSASATAPLTPTKAPACATCPISRATSICNAILPNPWSTTSSTSPSSRKNPSTTAAHRRFRCCGPTTLIGPAHWYPSPSTCCSTPCPPPNAATNWGRPYAAP